MIIFLQLFYLNRLQYPYHLRIGWTNQCHSLSQLKSTNNRHQSSRLNNELLQTQLEIDNHNVNGDERQQDGGDHNILEA